MLQTTGIDDQDHLAVIGAGQMISAQSLANKLNIQRVPTPSWMGNVSPQGISTPAEDLDYMPFEGVDFTNGGGAAVPLDDELVAFPQRPFRGERVILQCLLVPSGGGGPVDNLFAMIITPAIFVGAVQVGATQGGMPASAFGPGAFGVRLSFPVAGQGSRVVIPFQIPVVAVGDRVIVSGGIFGRAVR